MKNKRQVLRKILLLSLLGMFLMGFYPVVYSLHTDVTFTKLFEWTIGTSLPLGEAPQRCAVEYDGRTWFVYQNQTLYPNGEMGYASTTNGIDLTSFTSIEVTRAYRVSTDVDAGYIHIAWCNGTSNAPLKYRRGALNSSDGVITWDSVQTAVPAAVDVTYSRPYIELDSEGYAWIGYQVFIESNIAGYATKSSTKDGTWTTNSGFPLNVVDNSSLSWRVIPKRLLNQKMLVFYGYYGQKLGSRYWNGTSLASSINVTANTLRSTVIDVAANFVSVGNIIYIGYAHSYEAQVTDYYFLTYDGSSQTFSSEQHIYHYSINGFGVVLQYELSNGNLYYWSGCLESSVSTIHLMIFNNGQWTFNQTVVTKSDYGAGAYNIGLIGGAEFVTTKILFNVYGGAKNGVASIVYVIPPTPSEEPFSATSIVAPYAYAAISIMSLALLIGVGAALISSVAAQDVAPMIPVIIVGVAITIVLFIALSLLNAFSGL